MLTVTDKDRCSFWFLSSKSRQRRFTKATWLHVRPFVQGSEFYSWRGRSLPNPHSIKLFVFFRSNILPLCRRNVNFARYVEWNHCEHLQPMFLERKRTKSFRWKKSVFREEKAEEFRILFECGTVLARVLITPALVKFNTQHNWNDLNTVVTSLME